MENFDCIFDQSRRTLDQKQQEGVKWTPLDQREIYCIDSVIVVLGLNTQQRHKLSKESEIPCFPPLPSHNVLLPDVESEAAIMIDIMIQMDDGLQIKTDGGDTALTHFLDLENSLSRGTVRTQNLIKHENSSENELWETGSTEFFFLRYSAAAKR